MNVDCSFLLIKNLILFLVFKFSHIKGFIVSGKDGDRGKCKGV